MKYVTLFCFFFLSFTSVLFPQWIPQSSGVTSELNSVYFFDAQTGWAVGDNGVIVNTNYSNLVNNHEWVINDIVDHKDFKLFAGDLVGRSEFADRKAGDVIVRSPISFDHRIMFKSLMNMMFEVSQLGGSLNSLYKYLKYKQKYTDLSK